MIEALMKKIFETNFLAFIKIDLNEKVHQKGLFYLNGKFIRGSPLRSMYL